MILQFNLRRYEMNEHQEQGQRYEVTRHRKPGFLRFGLIALVAILILGFGGNAIQQSAWSQGYVAGLAAGGAGGDALSQYVLYNSRPSGPPSGLIFLLFLGLGGFLLFSAGKRMRTRHMRMAGGPEGEGWRPPWGGGPPPWAKHWGPPYGDAEAQPRPPTPEAEDTGIQPTAGADDVG
jgi:hypothetical protein